MPKKSVSSKSRKTTTKKYINPQRGGVSKVVLIGAGALAVAVVLVGGYLVMGQKMGLTKVPFLPAKVALNPNCVYKDPDLCKFVNNVNAQTNYIVTSTSSLGGMNIESVFEISGTDKSHMLSKQNGKEVSNTISIGDTSYILDYADNKWLKLTAAPDKSQNPEKELKDQFAVSEKDSTVDTTTYKFVVKEACGNKTCFKYEIVDPSSLDTKQFIWFDDSDYLLRKIRMEDKTNGSSDSVYEYGNVNISTPSPVKEDNSAGSADVNSDQKVQQMMKQYQQQAPADNSANQEAPVDDNSSADY